MGNWRSSAQAVASSQSSLLEDLLPEIKDLIFSCLSVNDLKNLRLCSLRLSGDVMRLDKRFRVYTLRSSENLPQVLYSSATTVCVDNRKFKGNATKLSDWIKLNSCNISVVKLTLYNPDEKFLEILKLTSESLEELSITAWKEIEMPVLDQRFSKLKILSLYMEETRNMTQFLEKCTETVSRISFGNLDFNNVTTERTKFRALKLIDIDHVTMKMSQLKDLIRESSQGLKTMALSYISLERDSDMNIVLPSLSYLSLSRYSDYGWTVNFMKTLKTLCLDSCSGDWLDQIDQNLPNLKKLKIQYLSWSPDRVRLLFDKFSNLETLVLNNLQHDEELSVPGLKHLFMWYRRNFMVSLLNSCRSSLEVLSLHDADLSDFHDVDGRLTNLKKLHICSSLSEEDRKWLQESLVPGDAEEWSYGRGSGFCYCTKLEKLCS